MEIPTTEKQVCVCVIDNSVRCVWGQIVNDVAHLRDAGMLCAVVMTTRYQLGNLYANGSARPNLAPVWQDLVAMATQPFFFFFTLHTGTNLFPVIS